MIVTRLLTAKQQSSLRMELKNLLVQSVLWDPMKKAIIMGIIL